MKNLMSMEERKNSCRVRTTLPNKNSDGIPRGDAIIRDHQVDAGTSLSALVDFVGGKFRIVEKPTLSDAYTVLLFSFSSSGLTTACIKLIATSKLTEERLKSYPSKVKITSDDTLQVDGANLVMVKRLVLFKQILPLDVKQKNPNVLVPQGGECHIKYIAVDHTSNCNVVVFVTETISIPCYLADENNQCDCRYVLAQLSKRLREEPSRELSQKLQYDCTIPMQQNNALHVCMFCGKTLLRAKQCGRICEEAFTKQNFRSRPVSRTVSNLKPKCKNRTKKPCGCCSKQRKGKEQSEAYLLKRSNDYSTAEDETKMGRRNDSRPCYTEYNRCRPQYKPYSQCTPQPERKPQFKLSPEGKCCLKLRNKPTYKPFSEYEPCGTESKTRCRMYVKCHSGEILRQECSAAKRGSIASSEYYTSDTQTELPIDNTDFYLICQAYELKSDKQPCNKRNQKILEEKPETTYEHLKKLRLQSQKDHVGGPRTETGSNHITRSDTSDKSSRDSTNSTTKQLSTDEEVKEISIESTDTYLAVQRHNAISGKDKNLFIGRMEGSNFNAYPFRNNFVRLYGSCESHNTCRKFPSVNSGSRNGSYLRIRRRPKRPVFPKKLFKPFHFQEQTIVNSNPSTCYSSSNDSSKLRPIQPVSILFPPNQRKEW